MKVYKSIIVMMQINLNLKRVEHMKINLSLTSGLKKDSKIVI